ncbi:MAG: hypothetical protein Kow00117_20600 [Phototrophicales bacterium]
MQLERITIQGFTSIREAVVEMRPLNILIGADRLTKLESL